MFRRGEQMIEVFFQSLTQAYSENEILDLPAEVKPMTF